MELTAKSCKGASLLLQKSTPGQRVAALNAVHAVLSERKQEILDANERDIELAKELVEQGALSGTLLKRLDLSGQKFVDLLQGIRDVTMLPCPTGIKTLSRRLAEGLDLYRITCPIGALLVIFESRPEVVIQVACLALFSGNGLILKGGKEASHSNRILFTCLQSALASLACPVISKDCIQMVEGREDISALLGLDRFIDMVIPRGSKTLVQHIQNNTRIPVLGHADGLCSIFVDVSASVESSAGVIVDSKCNYPAACNAVETLLIHAEAPDELVHSIYVALVGARVKIKCCAEAYKRFEGFGAGVLCERAVDADFDTEFLDLTIAVKVVDSISDAIEHINTHGSHHTDCILTASDENARVFTESIDSAGCYVNCSTRFADGFRYGFGAEIGVSTSKTHARGPVGLEGLVIYKYVVQGTGQCVGEFGEGKKQYLHQDM